MPATIPFICAVCSSVEPPAYKSIQRTFTRIICDAAVTHIEDVTLAPGQNNEHYRIDTDSGTYLAKVLRKDCAHAQFWGERASLAALKENAPSGLLIPECVGVCSLDEEVGAMALFPWLQFAPFGVCKSLVQWRLGVGVARLHEMSAASDCAQFGFGCMTYLNTFPQDNRWENTWNDFFMNRRLRPRLEKCIERYTMENAYGTSNETAGALVTLGGRVMAEWLTLCDVLFKGVVVKPTLLHGDLFMGNCGALRGCDTPVVFDPATYWGHHEMDLALSSLFGTFTHEFYDAYHEVLPKERGFAQRRLLYRLYYLLHMLLMHGAGFGRQGSTEEPRGYFELACDHLRMLCELIE